jgi:hypothetical protein
VPPELLDVVLGREMPRTPSSSAKRFKPPPAAQPWRKKTPRQNPTTERPAMFSGIANTQLTGPLGP